MDAVLFGDECHSGYSEYCLIYFLFQSKNPKNTKYGGMFFYVFKVAKLS